MLDTTTDRLARTGVEELHRLCHEAPDVMAEVIAFLKQRHHTATITLRFHGEKLKAADLLKVSSQRPDNGSRE